MKKVISKFADSLLSRDELKQIEGGYEQEAGCPSCTGSQLLCSINFDDSCVCFADSERTCGE